MARAILLLARTTGFGGVGSSLPRPASAGPACAWLLGLLCLAAGCFDNAPGPGQQGLQAVRPNVLLIVIDTLRADRLGIYGFPLDTSPNLDRFAGAGVHLTNYRTVVPTTLAAVTTTLSGRYPHSHGVYRNGVAWPDDLEGVQSVFRTAGYRTAAFVASYCLASVFGVSRGFDDFDEDLDIPMADLRSNQLIRRGESVTDAVIDWLNEVEGSQQPFFSLVHYFDPHWPYQPPPPFDSMFDPNHEASATGAMEDFPRVRRELTLRGGRPSANSRHLHALYLGEVRYTDHEIGRLLGELERRGLRDNTLVIITADHGETFDEHPDYFDHGQSVYDSAIRIPLLVAGPELPIDGRGIDASLSNVDLAPTLLEYAALEVPAAFEGRSFLALLRGEVGDASGDVFAEATKPTMVEPGQRWPNRRKARGIVRDNWKLIHTPWDEQRFELYDLSNDPGETRNLWGSPLSSERRRAMAQSLALWSESEPERVPEAPDTRSDVAERLRALGYAE